METEKDDSRSKFRKKTLPKLKQSLNKKNIYEVPVVEKIVVNIGFGKLGPDKKQIEQIVSRLGNITGQKPVTTKARKAIAGFKIREGQIIGAKVTLRKTKMHDFLTKLVSIVLPRLRDFRGVDEKSFDGRGDYAIGFQEINVFPEIEYTRGEKALGLEVVISTSAKSDEEAKSLLSELGLPFKEKSNQKKKEAAEARV